jgi:hypothetical protein
MSLSVEKLNRILKELHCISTNYYIYKKRIIYIECIYLKTKDPFMIFVSDNYKFKYNDENNIKLKRIQDNDVDRILENYSKDENKLDTLKIYNNNLYVTDVDNNPTIIEENLQEGYNISLDLENKNDEKFQIRDIKRQARRLKLSVEGSKYRLSVIQNNFMVIPRKDDDVIFFMKNIIIDKNRKIYVIIDIESIITDTKILENINKIYNGFIDILNKNIIINKNKLDEFKNTDITLESVISVVEKINRYSEYIEEFEDIIREKEEQENEILEKINLIRNKPKYGLNDDLKNAPVLLDLDNKLNKLNTERNEYINKIIELKNKQNNNSLILDKILFDNIMLLSTIKFNLTQLKLIK